MKAGRFVVLFFGVSFAAIGAAVWLAPEQAAASLALQPAGAAGLIAIRAEVGGVFGGLAALCLAGAAVKQRLVLFSAATVVAAIAAGRIMGMLADGASEAQLGALAIEVAAIAALTVHARSLAIPAGVEHRPLSRRWIVATGTVVVLAGGVVIALFDPRVEQWLFDRGAARVTARDMSHLFGDDALRVGICGSSAPLPSPDRAKACVAVFAGERFYVVDVGPESVENLVRWGIPLSRIGGVLLTHFHSDHIGDLGELNLQTWAGGRPSPLAVYGGPGVERVVEGFNAAYRQDQGYRTAHHTERIMPSATWPMVAHPVALDGYPSAAKDRTALVLEDGALRITAIEVDHAPIEPAYAYRFDYRGRSVVVTGDLKFHAPLIDAAKGADILVSEAIARPMAAALQNGAAAAGRERQATIMHDIQDYHISPAEAAQIAEQAGAKLLVFYHLLPAPDTFLARRLFASDVRRARDGAWSLAADGSLYTAPAGS
ncbi:MAG TPA: MBL fold metallo-hydrolase, partial [Vicinamibacterales bacterium]|nr:MBL fold metallo-hydrolase [Vicinamibacterales bacterium]